MDSGAELHWISSEAEGPVGGEVAAHGTPTSTLSTIESSQPADSHDLAVLNIEGVDRASGQHDEGSPRMLPGDPFLRGAVNGLDGTAVTGWIESPADLPINLTLFVDASKATQGSVTRGPGGRHEFRLPIPDHWLDGLPHVLTVLVTETGQVIGQCAEILPAIATPWPSMQQYAGTRLLSSLAPAAGRRYESIVRWLRDSPQVDAQQRLDSLAQVSRAHEVLVRGPGAIRGLAPLAFPEIDDPAVSVVVPVHNHVAVTYACLAALRFACNETSFEVIVVDDGSTDETLALPDLIHGVTFVRKETAEGFVRACNFGARSARGAYLVFLNNDTEPTVGWLDELVRVFATFRDVGLAGSKLLYPDGRLQDAGGIVWNTGNPWNYGRGGNPEDPRYTYTRQADYLTGAAIMISRDVWELVGGFSEEFCPAYFEDTDLAFKVRAIGKRVVYAPLSVVYHYDGMSSGAGTEQGVKKYQEINRPTFRRRWVFAYASHSREGQNVDLAKDRDASLRALVIDHHVPHPDRDAGSYAAIQEMRLLQAIGCKVTFLPLNFAYLGSYTQALQRLGIECLHAPFFTSVHDVLSRRGGEFDLVYVTRYTAARRVMKDVRRLAPHAKVLFCNADLHFLRILRSALAAGDTQAVRQAKWIRSEELSVMRQADVVLSYNDVEHAVILSHNFEKSRVVLAPWVVDVRDDIPPFSERRDVAFLGGFAHPPNAPAVRYFVREVMPLLRRRLPGVRFRVYGSNAPDDLKALQGDDVLIEGYVEDLADVYDRCRVFVAPLLAGAGLKGKVVDALAHGTPSVLSPMAAEGTGIRHGFEALIAETPGAWADAIATLYEDPRRWQEMSERARSLARAAYSFERGCGLMESALRAAGLDPPSEALTLVSRTARLA